MTSLQIPEHVVLNETVRMQCNFNLDKELLYSVKWYKDGHEFYRYVPRDAPSVLIFPVPGVNVNVSAICRRLRILRISRFSPNIEAISRDRLSFATRQPLSYRLYLRIWNSAVRINHFNNLLFEYLGYIGWI